MSALPTAAALFEKLPRALRRHRLMTGWMRLTGEDPLQKVRIRDDSFGFADMSNGFLRLIVIEGDYEVDFFDIADRFLANGGTFVDVGAHHGLFSFGLAGRHAGGVDFHLFEPNPLLARSIERTRALYPQMTCRLNEVVVSDRGGVVAFSIDSDQSGMSHIADNDQGNAEFASVTLDDYIGSAGVAAVNLVKMDIEGYELLALRGARAALRSRKIRGVYFEYCEKWLRRVSEPREVIDFLDSVGFATCLCRRADLLACGGPSHTIAPGHPGQGLALRPLGEAAPPQSTDLLAVPYEALSPLPVAEVAP